MRLESKTYTHPDGNVTELIPSEGSKYYLVGLYSLDGTTGRSDCGNHRTNRFQPRNVIEALQHLVSLNFAKHH